MLLANQPMTNHYKYPRTPHLPWSPGVSEDDLRKKSIASFEGENIVITEKMDGENTTLYRDYSHARSLDSTHHPSRDWLKQWHSTIAHTIPEGWRIAGENLFARHSVAYEHLTSYFYGFSIWNDENVCLSWPETLEWFDLLGVHPVPELYRGPWDEKLIQAIDINSSKSEGYVVRKLGAFTYANFGQSVAKWVRKNHVQTDNHWMHAEIVPNQLTNNDNE